MAHDKFEEFAEFHDNFSSYIAQIRELNSKLTAANARIAELENRLSTIIRIGQKWGHTSETSVQLLDEIDAAARAALSEAPGTGTNGWQPIETAPKDGTLIDLWTGECRFADCRWGRFDDHSRVPFGPKHWCGLPFDLAPTHWRLAPAPPAITVKE